VALALAPVLDAHPWSITGSRAHRLDAVEVADGVEVSTRCSGADLPCYAWDAYRGWLNQFFTTTAVVWGTIHGGTCKGVGHDLFVCTSMPGGYGGKGGVAIGTCRRARPARSGTSRLKARSTPARS
jgi:hypothetical protein